MARASRCRITLRKRRGRGAIFQRVMWTSRQVVGSKSSRRALTPQRHTFPFCRPALPTHFRPTRCPSIASRCSTCLGAMLTSFVPLTAAACAPSASSPLPGWVRWALRAGRRLRKQMGPRTACPLCPCFVLPRCLKAWGGTTKGPWGWKRSTVCLSSTFGGREQRMGAFRWCKTSAAGGVGMGGCLAAGETEGCCLILRQTGFWKLAGRVRRRMVRVPLSWSTTALSWHQWSCTERTRACSRHQKGFEYISPTTG
mmetsp:Transcript_19725/g.47559  ORF Transcript_19725/g.47559 Transcript_19725/m.47559 type:complete len:255 (-) Transcript_19725:4361-5125(-)